MTSFTGVLDNSETDVEGHFKLLAQLFNSGVATSVDANALKVSQKGGGADMSVDIAVGSAILNRPNNSYGYQSWTDAVTNVPLDAANPTNPRIDTIIAYVDPETTTLSAANSPGSFKFKKYTGTPSGTPAAVSDSSIQSNLGSSIAWIKLATVQVAAGAIQILTGNITDTRSPITSRLPIGDGAISVAAMFAAALNPETRTSEALGSFIPSGLTLSFTGGTLNWSVAAGVEYVNGKRISVSAANGSVTANRDTYFYVDSTGTVGSSSVNNGVSAPSLPANSVWIGMAVSGASAISSVFDLRPSASMSINNRNALTTPFNLIIGGIQISGGTFAATNGGTNVTFPRPFASPPVATVSVQDPGNQYAQLYEAPSTTGLKAKQSYTGGPLTVHWIAIGKAL
ncbi:hypothetical protein AB0H71_28835 [Nocardia sp. NPDC050697]|uniref:hypothetical protein n=1 Tax=Nocardia sp. NPDC050697 TaxID=3155158 RepID=UPI0033C75605